MSLSSIPRFSGQRRALLLRATSAASLALLATMPSFAADHENVVTRTVHVFAPDEGHDGRTALLQGADGALYGVTLGGGSAGRGTVFRLGAEGALRTLHSFEPTATTGAQPGSSPVIGADGALYGSTQFGGASDYGTVYRLDPSGAVSTLHSFVPNNIFQVGSYTWLTAGKDGLLYGVSRLDGSFDAGKIFRLKTDGSGYEELHQFTGGDGGGDPWAALLQARDGSFYGTTRSGGNGNVGTIYRITAAGAFEVINSFYNGGEADGAYPSADLVEDAAGNLYGTTEFGGLYGAGTVFRRKPDGTLETLHSFLHRGDRGYGPTARLALDPQGRLYGVTRYGGPHRKGTVFTLTDAGRFRYLHSFGDSKKKGGRYPWGPLTIASDGFLYGMTAGGGSLAPDGTIYRIEPK